MIKQFNVKIPAIKGINTVADDVREFVASGAENCEIDTSGYCGNIKSARAIYQTTVNRLGVNVSVTIRKSCLFLVRKEKMQ